MTSKEDQSKDSGNEDRQIQVLRNIESEEIKKRRKVANDLVEATTWTELKEADTEFAWFEPLREKKDIALARLGLVYEYARETTKLKQLFALLETKEQFPSLAPLRAEVDGLDEPTAEKTLRAFYSPLRKLRHFLIANYSFEELSRLFGDDLNAALGRSHDSTNITDKFDRENVSYCLARSAVSLRYDGDRADATTVEDFLGGEKRGRKWVQDDKGAVAEDLVLRIDWRDYRNEELTKKFEAFIDFHRPKEVFPEPKPNMGRGRSENQHLGKSLKNLAWMRRINRYPMGELCIYCEGTNEFYRYAKEARQYFQWLFPFEAQPLNGLTYKQLNDD